ncbi:hypothetical protein B0H16DRAFT_790202 [Mycena metata]|uniref:Uncharacterized protein n=1 Tax=Mycena metata TaxID=1033252 RepID=A0AAD7DSQ3_9AGAR|nr:hypothetical protein B0H16DRAFT_790202 [Mycena metata]
MASERPPPYEKSLAANKPSKSHLSLREKNSPSTSLASNSKTQALLAEKRSVLGRFGRASLSPDSVKAAVLEDARSLVQPYTEESIADRIALLESCAQLCARQKINLSLLLQGKLVENHSALYWAIVNGPWPPTAPFGLVAAVLAHSSPLQPATIREARRACVSLRSHDMYRFLQMSPEFGALSAEDRFLLGTLVPVEEIVVEEMAGDTCPFSVRFHIPMFHKRMMLGKSIKLEFIAQGRLWELDFFTAADSSLKSVTPGCWSGLLRIAENSPMTPVMFGLVFLDARPSPPSPTPFWVSRGRKEYIMHVTGESGSETASGMVSWSWTMFKHDSVCIARDGSVTGILGMKLVVGDVPSDLVPASIPTTADAQCIIC